MLRSVSVLKFVLLFALVLALVLVLLSAPLRIGYARLLPLSQKTTVPEQAVNGPRQSLFSGMQADNKARVTTDNPVRLPADHAPHADYQLEWWYFTFLLEDTHGEPFNYQFTLFRVAQPDMASNWGEGQIWMGHSSLHTDTVHFFSEKFAQQGTGIAGYTSSPFTFYIDSWQWQSVTDDSFFPARLQSSARTAKVDLHLQTSKPFIKHGNKGVSFKTADGKYRSYYYSQPFIDTTGTVYLNGETYSVSGIGWYDHEWTSQLTDAEALGWDWFSLHFNDGRKLMVFTMHVNNRPATTSGTLISSDGGVECLNSTEIILMPVEVQQVAGRELPLNWRIQVPAANIDIVTSPFKADQFNDSRFPYYEGAIRFSGSHEGKGFMELTGYQ